MHLRQRLRNWNVHGIATAEGMRRRGCIVFGRPLYAGTSLGMLETAHLNEACRLFAGLGFETIVLDLDAYFLDDLLKGRLAHDECWMILPWSKRDLQGFPALKVFAERSSVRCS